MSSINTTIRYRRATDQTQMMAVFLIAMSLIVPLPASSLMTKLENALDAVAASDPATARSCLTAFIIECQSQCGTQLTHEQSARLINSANQIKSDLACSEVCWAIGPLVPRATN